MKRKRAKDATTDEILPGKHKAIPEGPRNQMIAMITALEKIMPGWGIALFLLEPEENARKFGRDDPDFNYISNMSRDDMHAMLKAWLERNIRDGKVIDKITDEPPTGTKQ